MARERERERRQGGPVWEREVEQDNEWDGDGDGDGDGCGIGGRGEDVWLQLWSVSVHKDGRISSKSDLGLAVSKESVFFGRMTDQARLLIDRLCEAQAPAIPDIPDDLGTAPAAGPCVPWRPGLASPTHRSLGPLQAKRRERPGS